MEWTTDIKGQVAILYPKGKGQPISLLWDKRNFTAVFQAFQKVYSNTPNEFQGWVHFYIDGHLKYAKPFAFR